MSPNTPSQSPSLPPGAFVIGRAVGDFTMKNVPTKSGKTLQFVEGQVLAGRTFCQISEKFEGAVVPHMPKDGEEVRAVIVPDYKTNGVIVVSAHIERPSLLSTEAKK